jgi:hypothetical protein
LAFHNNGGANIRILKRIFMPKIGDKRRMRKLHKKKLHNFYAFSVFVRVITNRIRTVGHVARMKEDE